MDPIASMTSTSPMSAMDSMTSRDGLEAADVSAPPAIAMVFAAAAIQARVEALIVAKFGRVEAELNASGVVDSLGAMELLVLLQDEFEVRLAEVTVQDLSSVARIVSVIEAAMARR